MSRFLLLLVVILAIRFAFFYLHGEQQVFHESSSQQTTIFTGIKSHIESVFSHHLSSADSGLLMGIVFGGKDLDHDAVDAYQRTGVLHVVAASGMNVSMLTSLLLVTLVLFFRRTHALVLTLVAIFFYTALADFQPSIVRAAIMGGLALGAGIVGRQNTSLLALFFAAFIMLLVDPSLITSISFMLSFSATLGIILLDPILRRPLKSSLFEDFRTTLAAQIATTPILLFFFGNYSPVSILVNLLILWTVPPLMILGGVAALVSFIPILSTPFILLSLPLLMYFQGVVNFFAKYSIPIELDSIPWTVIVGYYLLLLAAIVWLSKKASVIRSPKR